MAVGAGSIKRAAKAKVEMTKKEETKIETAESKVAVEEKAVKKQTTKKQTGKKTAADTAPKVVQKSTEKTETVAAQKAVNEVCHVTEELPIHLL